MLQTKLEDLHKYSNLARSENSTKMQDNNNKRTEVKHDQMGGM